MSKRRDGNANLYKYGTQGLGDAYQNNGVGEGGGLSVGVLTLIGRAVAQTLGKKIIRYKRGMKS